MPRPVNFLRKIKGSNFNVISPQLSITYYNYIYISATLLIYIYSITFLLNSFEFCIYVPKLWFRNYEHKVISLCPLRWKHKWKFLLLVLILYRTLMTSRNVWTVVTGSSFVCPGWRIKSTPVLTELFYQKWKKMRELYWVFIAFAKYLVYIFHIKFSTQLLWVC